MKQLFLFYLESAYDKTSPTKVLNDMKIII